MKRLEGPTLTVVQVKGICTLSGELVVSVTYWPSGPKFTEGRILIDGSHPPWRELQLSCFKNPLRDQYLEQLGKMIRQWC